MQRRTSTERYNNFLNYYNFLPNSVTFRISSSKELEKWKNVQAFQLGQMINGKFFFSRDRREILLLKYDLMSRLLYELENYCIEKLAENKLLADDFDVTTITNLCEKTCDKFKKLMKEENADKFDQEFLKIFLDIHDYMTFYLTQSIKEMIALDYEKMFRKIVEISCDIMQNTLIEIYELDVLMCKMNLDLYNTPECIQKTGNSPIPFVIVSNFSEKVFKTLGICLISERLSIYRSYYDVHEVYLKNYTDHPINELLIDRLEKFKFNINYKMSLSY